MLILNSYKRIVDYHRLEFEFFDKNVCRIIAVKILILDSSTKSFDPIIIVYNFYVGKYVSTDKSDPKFVCSTSIDLFDTQIRTNYTAKGRGIFGKSVLVVLRNTKS